MNFGAHQSDNMKRKKEKNNETKVKNVVIELSENGLPPTLQEIQNEAEFSKPTCRKHLKDLIKRGELASKELGQDKRYFPPSYEPQEFEEYNRLETEIGEAIETLNSMLGNIRDPSRGEIADWIDRDEENHFFQRIYTKKKREFNLTKPEKEDFDKTKTSLPHKINDALLVEKEIHPRSAEKNFPIKELKEYFEDNRELFSKIDLDIHREDGKISQVVFEYPIELRKFTGSRYETFEFDT